MTLGGSGLAMGDVTVQRSGEGEKYLGRLKKGGTALEELDGLILE